MMFNFAEPSWIQIVSALGVPLALAIAIGNALWQSHLQKRQLRQAMFEKRFPVFVTLRQFLVSPTKTLEESGVFLRDTKEGKFLFGPAFDDFVNEVHTHSVRLHFLNEQLKDGQIPDERCLAERNVEEEWLIDAFVNAEKKFGPDLQLNDPGFFRSVVASIKKAAAASAKARSKVAKKRRR